eukprot:1632542-Prymnesium_polylepis.2
MQLQEAAEEEEEDEVIESAAEDEGGEQGRERKGSLRFGTHTCPLTHTYIHTVVNGTRRLPNSPLIDTYLVLVTTARGARSRPTPPPGAS